MQYYVILPIWLNINALWYTSFNKWNNHNVMNQNVSHWFVKKYKLSKCWIVIKRDLKELSNSQQHLPDVYKIMCYSCMEIHTQNKGTFLHLKRSHQLHLYTNNYFYTFKGTIRFIFTLGGATLHLWIGTNKPVCYRAANVTFFLVCLSWFRSYYILFQFWRMRILYTLIIRTCNELAKVLVWYCFVAV